MKKSSIFVLCIVCAFIKGIACDFISLYSKEYCINNGQSIKINLNVNNSYKTKEPSYEYQFKFDQFPEHDKTIISTSDAVEYSVIFDLFKSRSSNITVQVDVWLLGASSLKIGTVKDEKLTVCGWSTVQNNGPVTIDTPITFSVFNHYKTEVPSYEYRFKFDQFPQYDKTIVSTVNLYFEESSFISYTVTFDSLTSKAGNHTVQVDIWYCPLGVPSYSLGTVVNTFQLSDSLIGTIKYFQPIYDESLDENIISTAEYFQVKLIALVHDPRGFFLSQCQTSPTNITYEWIVNGSPQLENYHDRIIYRIFSEPQLNNISVIVTATKTIGNRLIQKSGLFNITLQSRNPITNLTIDGDTKVKESEILKLNATIHGGTPPFTFLWWISPESSINYQFNTDCEDTNESFCPITISFKEKGKKVLTFFAHYEEYKFSFRLRLPNWIGDKLRGQQLVIRTFPTEINYFKENTEYTKNISLEMESSCGTSKSAFDETDVVTLTLMEKRDNRSVPVQTIKIDPLSVDFYSPKITMKQFKMLAEDEISKRTEYCYMMCKVFPLFDLTQSDICQNTYRITSERTPEKISDSNYYSCWTCPEKIDYPQSFAEMEKFVKIMKYLQLFQYQSPSCKVNLSSKYQPIGSVELDNKTASSLPELNNNHYFVASFVDTKSQKSATIVLKDYKII